MESIKNIATIGSHSALQILKGAKLEGFTTTVICLRGREAPYESFHIADEIIRLESWNDFYILEDNLIKKSSIIIPHASFIEYLGLDRIKKLRIPYYGNKSILEWESDREKQRSWLKKAGLKLPGIYSKPEEIDRPVIVKFHGARGGKGYFLAKNEEDFNAKMTGYSGEKYIIQEYIIGVPMYAHYFYSSLDQTLEIMSFDIRYESNVDSLGRISARDQMALERVDPSYVVVGNIPVVVRESLLPHFFEIGLSVVNVSGDLDGIGLFGPFCLEGVLTPEQDFYVFELSARIVAGTNLYINGSPYTDLKYDVPMSTGRRIAREIRTANERNRQERITG